MIEFDKDIKRYVSSKNGMYMRYSDDSIIVLPYEKDTEITDYKRFIFSYIESMKSRKSLAYSLGLFCTPVSLPE